MRFLLSIALITILLALPVAAKDLVSGKMGLGVYLGGPTIGLYGDIPLSPMNNLNLMLTYSGDYLYMHGDYLWNWRASQEVESFYLYAGAGAELASVQDGKVYWGKQDQYSGFFFGARAIGGIRVNIPNLPLCFNLQFTPVIGLAPSVKFFPSGGAGLRYYF